MQPIVLFCFLLSGISGLTLEVVWTRMLEHVFGATTLAISTVLTCFMGGLALGSWLFGRFADRLRSPLMVYAIAEGIVGIAAFFIPLLVEGVYPDLNLWMAANLSNSFWTLSLVRFAAVAAVLIIPTTCMGATLPLLSRYFMTNEAQMNRVGSRIGVLYTVNTTGAIGGVFFTTFALLPVIGLSATNRVAATINICLCVAIVVSRKWLSLSTKNDSKDDVENDLETILAAEGTGLFCATKYERLTAMAAFFFSGLASMNLQVVWNRAMAMIIGASVYSFSLVLIAFLIGLTFGAAVFSKLSKRIANPVIALALVELGVAAAAMINHLYMDDLPRVFASIVTTHITSFEQHVGLIQFIMFSVAALAVLPATFCMGATFPLTIRIVSHGLGRVGRDVGEVYALNTFGAICGSFLSAFVFVPLFSHYFGGAGMQTTFFLSVAIYAALGLILLIVSRGPLLTRTLVAVPSGVLAVAFLLAAPGWDPAALTIGIFRLSLMKDALDEEAWGDPDIKYYYDGVSTTVSIELWGRHFALKNNGKVDASNGDDMPTQIMVAAYPLLLHPRGPEGLDVAIIGFGSGVTVGTALEFPIKHVDSVELENAVIEASRVFGAIEGEKIDPEFNVNHLLYRRPVDPGTGKSNPDYNWTDPNTYVMNERLAIYSNDGRNFLASSPKQYDIIVSEPSNPWITGVSNMFTKDNFVSAIQALKPDGIFCQWVQLYELSPENIKIIFRTFAEVFPYVALFSAEDLSSDTMLLGSFKPIDFDLERVRQAMKDDKVRAEMERAYIFSPTDVFARVLLIDKAELLNYTNGPKGGKAEDLSINTDDNALIEFAAPHDLITFSRFAGYLSTIYTNEWSYGHLNKVIKNFGKGVKRAQNMADQAVSLLRNGRKEEAAKFLEEAKKIAPKEPGILLALRIARLLRGTEGAPLPVFEDVEPTSSMTEDQSDELREKIADVKKSLDAGAFRDALERFSRIPDHLWRRGGPQILMLKGYLHYLNADPEDSEECEESLEILSQLVREHESYVANHPETYFYLALCHDNALHFDKAVKNIRSYVDLMEKREARARLSLAQAKANMEAMLRGVIGTMPIELPKDRTGSPTTDAQGESPKEKHLD
ncbi:MAG: spermidine synthase [Proteobacteria bacterium]|nr:spermidine synthase [Pseudomonadota bacterium]